jgi:Gram-negative bacterial TonB protein C-terminal/PilZ domain
MSNLQQYFGALTPVPDRRLQKRTTPASLAYVMFDDTNGGIVLNISETGMAVAAADLLVVGDYLPGIRIQFPGSRQSIKICGQIVWLAESKKGAGIRFVDLNAGARNQISNWIASEKAAFEFELLPKLLRRDNEPLEISSRKFRSIFSNPSIGDGEAAACYLEMFPSESAHAKHTISADEIKPQQGPLPTPVRSETDPGDSTLHSAAKISTADLPQTFSLPQVQTAPQLAAPGASDTPVILDVSGLQVAALVFLFAVIGLIIGIVATKTGSNVLASLGRSPFGKQMRLRSPNPHTQSASGPPFDSAPIVAPTETSPAQTTQPPVDTDRSTGANSAGSSRPPEEKAKEGPRDSEPSVKAPSTDSNSPTRREPKPSADPKERPNGNDFTGLIARSAPLPAGADHAHSAAADGPIRSAPGNRALLSTKPATPAASKPSPPTASLKHASPAVAVGPRGTALGNPASHTAKPAAAEASKPSIVVGTNHDHPDVTAGPKGAAPGNPASHTAKPAAVAAPKPSPPPASAKPANPTVAAGPKGAAPGSPATPTAKPATTAAPTPSAPPAITKPTNPAAAASPKGAAPESPAPPTTKPAAPAVLNPPPFANPEPAHPAVAAGPKSAAPESPAPLTAKPATPAVPNPPPSAYVVTVPSKGSKPLKQVFPQKQIAFSSSLTITTQLSVLISPEPGAAAAHQPARLQAGDLVSYVAPRQPRPADGYRSAETVKVRATIGPQGQVMDVRPVSGPIFLLSSATSAIRQWRYKPTLLNEKPVQAQQDVTIEFRLPRQNP